MKQSIRINASYETEDKPLTSIGILSKVQEAIPGLNVSIVSVGTESVRPCGMCGSTSGTYRDDDRGGWEACNGCGAI